MSKVTSKSDLRSVSDPGEFQNYASNLIHEMTGTMNGKLEYDKNFLSQTVTVKFNNINTDQSVPHNLNKKVINYHVVNKSVSCDVFNGKTSNTASTVYLQCSAKATVTLILF